MRDAHRVAALVDADLAEDRLQSILHRIGRHADQPGDLLVGVAMAEMKEDFRFGFVEHAVVRGLRLT